MRQGLWAGTLALLIAIASQAQAQDDAKQGTTRSWYGWQILVTDVAALGAGVAIGSASDDRGNRRYGDVVGSMWGIGMVGSVAVHGAHHNGTIGLASMGARLVLPPISAALGLGAGCLFSGFADDCASDGSRFGFAIGAVGASALDIALVARERPQARPTHWYGWQTLILDAVSFGAGIVFVSRRQDEVEDFDRRERVASLAVMPYVTGILLAPWIHGFQGRWGLAFADLGLRAVAPGIATIGGLIGYCAATGGADECIGDGAVYGFAGGTFLIAAIDIAVLAHEKVEGQRAAREAEALAFTPYLMPQRGGFSAGLAGNF